MKGDTDNRVPYFWTDTFDPILDIEDIEDFPGQVIETQANSNYTKHHLAKDRRHM